MTALTPKQAFSKPAPYGYLPASKPTPENKPSLENTRTKKRRFKKKMTNLYQSVTDSVIAQLEAGCVPWVQPWGRPDIKTPMGLPTNGHTSRHYSGINILLLWGAAIDTRRTTQTWLTYKQALKLGGNVRAGESGTTVCYASSFTPKAEKEHAASNGLEPQSIGFLKRYTVFNADQCEGLSDEFYKDVEPLPDCETIKVAENLINATGADFRIGGDKAFYMPSKDCIQVPPQPAFFEQINYYRTCFHELGHWTGHKSRLDRNLSGNKGTKLYAREELVAEMTSAFICAHLGIQPTVRHTDYLGSWLRLLKDDKRAIFKAASQASKAANFILECLNTPPNQPAPQRTQAPVKRQLEIAA